MTSKNVYYNVFFIHPVWDNETPNQEVTDCFIGFLDSQAT